MNTKEKIIQAALKLFNEHGVASIRLQQIADEIGISVGNLAYHFKTKEVIVLSVYDDLFYDFNKILSGYLQSASIEAFDDQIASYYNFFSKYQFYISDLFSTEHDIPEVKKDWQMCLSKMYIQIRKLLEFYVKKGDLINTNKETYDILADTLVMLLIFWIPQQKINQKNVSSFEYKACFWMLIKPYFSLNHGGDLKLNSINAF